MCCLSHVFCSSSWCHSNARLFVVCHELVALPVDVFSMLDFGAMWHGFSDDPPGVICMLHCVLSVMVCLLFLLVSYARLCPVGDGLLVLPLGVIC